MANHEFTGVFIPAHIWLSKELEPAEKMLLGEIEALSKKTGWCSAGRKHFAEWLNCSEPNVSYYTAKLERMGFVEVKRTPGFGSKMRVVFTKFYADQPVNEIYGGSKPGLRGVVNGVYGGSKEALPVNTIEIQNNKERGEKEKNALSPSENQISLEAEKEKKAPPVAPAPPVGTFTLEPPFSHVATIEPQQPRIVRLHTPDLPGVELIEPAPKPIPHTPDPRSRPAETFARVDIADEIAELKSDQLAKETFVMSRKIPVRYFEEYADAFKADVLGRGETYHSRKDFRRHFFSWCGVRYEISQRALTKNGASHAHLTPGGANPAVYLEKQKF